MIRNLLGDSSNLGISLQYKEHLNPDGIAQAFILRKEFIAGSPVCLVLGDSIYCGQDLVSWLEKATKL